jgi:hypothetical protein
MSRGRRCSGSGQEGNMRLRTTAEGGERKRVKEATGGAAAPESAGGPVVGEARQRQFFALWKFEPILIATFRKFH